MKVAFQGIQGAYSEVAVYNHFGDEAIAIGYPLFEEVFDAVVEEEVDAGIIPVENSIAGSVSRNLDFFLEKPAFAIAEIYLPIRHCLLARDGVTLDDITTVLSHPVALEQCEEFIQSYHLNPLPEYDTAGAAKIIAEEDEPDRAAIASALAGKIYGLQILAGDIQKTRVNSTRFLVIVREDPGGYHREKTSIAFKTKHAPGALENALHTLSANQVNLTRIQSRPIPENPWEYVFYADFEGGIDDTNVNIALRELEQEAAYVKVLGSYPKGDYSEPPALRSES